MRLIIGTVLIFRSSTFTVSIGPSKDEDEKIMRRKFARAGEEVGTVDGGSVVKRKIVNHLNKRPKGGTSLARLEIPV